MGARVFGEEHAECQSHYGSQGGQHGGHFTTSVQRCEVLLVSHWLPVALDPPSGREQPIAGLMLTGRGAPHDATCHFVCVPTPMFLLPSPRQGLWGPPEHRPLSTQGLWPPQQVPCPLSNLKDPPRARRKEGAGTAQG